MPTFSPWIIPTSAGLKDVKDHDGHARLHAEGDGGGVHDLEAAVQDLQVGELVKAHRLRVFAGVVGVDPVHLVFGHEDHLGPHLQGAEGGGGVRGEEGVPRSPAEDDDAFLLQVAEGPAADVGLGHLGDGEGGLDPGGDGEGFQGILQGQGVHDGGQHPDVVGGGPVHPHPLPGPPP